MVGVGGFARTGGRLPEPPAFRPRRTLQHMTEQIRGRMVGVGGFARTGRRLPEPPAFRPRRALQHMTEQIRGRMVGVGGFEPPTSRSRTVRSSLTELHPGCHQFYMINLTTCEAAGQPAA